MQEEFENPRTIAGNVPFEGTDVVEALLPEILANQRLWQPLAIEQSRMNPHDQYFFVMRTIEDSDAATFRQAPRCAPKKIMIQLLCTRLFERMHFHALRIEARHHVLDYA